MEQKPTETEVKVVGLDAKDLKKTLACPVPKRTVKLEQLGFMKNEVRFFSENIHMANKFKGKRTTSFRPSRVSKRKKRFEKLKQQSAKFGISFGNLKPKLSIQEADSKAEEEDENLNKGEEEKGTQKDTTKGSSNDQGSKEEQEKAGEEPIEIDRCSNPMSHLLEDKMGFEFDGSISEEGSNEMDDSFEF